MSDKRSEADDQAVEQRRDDALRRALNMPPKPHKKSKGGASKVVSKPRQKEERGET